MLTYLVTGCCGFIGSNLVDRLLSLGYRVIGIDNLSTGLPQFISSARNSNNFKFYNFDVLNLGDILPLFKGVDIVIHLSANADIRDGVNFPRRDLEQNTIATHNVLEAMRHHGIKKIVFSSTGSVYGEADLIPTPESVGFPVQTSLYAASKLAGESLITAYCEAYQMRCWIFRFVSILGERYTHGHVYDFYRQLSKTPGQLRVLGNGKQKKSYLYVQDCIDAILLALEKSEGKVNIFNLGTDEFCEVNDSIDIICSELKLKPSLLYSGGDRGWVGDNPFIYLDTKKIRGLGWVPKLSIADGILRTVRYLKQNEWVFEERL